MSDNRKQSERVPLGSLKCRAALKRSRALDLSLHSLYEGQATKNIKQMTRINPLKRLLYSPFLVQLVVTRRCNLSCTYCNEFDDHSPPVSVELLKERIDKIADLGCFALELTGGEPMLHSEIFELLNYARSKRRFHKLMMISNAYLLNREKVQRLNEAGLQEMQISVDGVEPNDSTIKVLKTLRRKLEVIAEEARFKVVLSGVLGSAPPGEALEVVKFAQEHRFIPRVLVLHDHEGQMQSSPEEMEIYRQIQGRIGRRFKEAGDYRATLMRQGRAPFRCRSGSRYLYVDEHGMVRWCSQTREFWGKALMEYSPADLKEQFHTPKDCNKGCTVGCARTCSAPDEWRPQRGQPQSPF